MDKLKAVLPKNRWLLFLLPVFAMAVFLLAEFLFDKILGDGDGIITAPVFLSVKSFFLLVAFVILCFCFFKVLLRMDMGASLFNLFFLLLILYGTEFYFRKTDPFLNHLPFDSNYYAANQALYKGLLTPPVPSDKDIITWGNTVSLNSHGFRDREVDTSKREEIRVMLLGDSFTWGAGLGVNERYGNIVEQNLQKYFGNRTLRVYNLGLSGASTVSELATLNRMKLLIKPHAIVVGFCMNDPQPKSQSYSTEKEQFEKKWGGLVNSIQNGFSTIKLRYFGKKIKDAILLLNIKLGNIPSEVEALGRAYKVNSAEWLNFKHALAGIKTVCDSLGCGKPVFCGFSQFGSIEFNGPLPEREKSDLNIRKKWFYQACALAKETGFIAINYIPVCEQAARNNVITPQSAVVNALDGHPGPELNKLYAQELYTALVTLLTDRISQKNVAEKAD